MVIISSLVHWVTQLHCFISEGPGKMSIPWLLFLSGHMSHMGVTILGVWWKKWATRASWTASKCQMHTSQPFQLVILALQEWPISLYSNKAEDHKCEYLLLVPGVKQGMSTVALGANSCPDVLWKGLHKEGLSCIVKALNAFFARQSNVAHHFMGKQFRAYSTHTTI